jgi:outer membrane protein OmpA-like peptidoglycan-associated protein
MYTRAAAALIVVGGLIIGTARAQTLPNPSQQLITTPAQDVVVPVFRVTVVGRTTPAINYRPRKGVTKVDFTGTALLPRAEGNATVEGKKGYIHIDARFDDLEPATRFGPEYLTYVLWAITPEGRATNLGEIQVDDDDARIQVTTELQAFGMVVTAEPYFSVTQPSDVVVMENSVRDNTKGNVEIIQAKYNLLKRGTYLMNQDASHLKLKPLEPGKALDLAEARNAVALARIANADRYASDTFAKATALLTEAEQAREHHRSSNAVMMPARQAAQTAEDARLISLQKQEEEFQTIQRAAAQRREVDALISARTEQAARQQAEIDKLTAEAARVAAERDKAAAESARVAAEVQAQALAAQSDREKAAAEAARVAAESREQQAQALAAQSERDKAAAEAARLNAESARIAAEAQAQQARDLAAQADRDKAELRDQLRQQLNVILETRETARGLIVNLSDVLFDTASANLRPGAREKLAKVVGVILAHPGLKIQVEGHADSVGATDYNQRLSENRADSVRDYLVRQGITPTAVATAGFGESHPVVSNNTAAGRQQNRRVELVVSGEPISATSLTSIRPAP